LVVTGEAGLFVVLGADFSFEQKFDFMASLAENLYAPHLNFCVFFLSEPTCPLSTILVTSRGSFLLSAFTMDTSTLPSLSSKSMLVQLPRSRPSQVSSFPAFHSLPKVFESFLVVQHLLRSQILILMSSSEPTGPICTSICLKIMFEAALTAVVVRMSVTTNETTVVVMVKVVMMLLIELYKVC